MAPQDAPRVMSTTSEVNEKVKLDVHTEEVAIAKLTEDDVYALSQQALQFKGKAAVRIFLIMVVMGCNQAGMTEHDLALIELLIDGFGRIRCRLGCHLWSQCD